MATTLEKIKGCMFGGAIGDTQMTLFTANGLLIVHTRACLRGIRGPWQEYVRMAYKNWLKTQDKYFELSSDVMNCWLMNCKELYSKGVIEELSVDMYEDCKASKYGSDCDERWWTKYGTCEYCGSRKWNCCECE